MQYDTIVIDEAHERSLNIDFLLGYLTALLPKRRDLKLVITSATIDSVKFQEHFEHALHTKVPVIEVSGRTYPVQVVYEPLGTAPALMRSVPGFETGAMPGDADYEALSAAPDGRDGRDSREHERGHADRGGARLRRIGDPFHVTTVVRATFSCSLPASATSTISRTRCAAITVRARRICAVLMRSRSCRCSRGCPRRSSISVFEPHDASAYCDRHECRRNVADGAGHPLCGRSGHGAYLPLFEDARRCSVCRSSRSARRARTSVRAVAAVSPTALRFACIRVRISRRVPEFTEPEILRTSLGAVVLHMLSVGVARTAQDVTDFGFHRSAGYEGGVGWFQRADRAEGRGAQAWRGGADAYRPSCWHAFRSTCVWAV